MNDDEDILKQLAEAVVLDLNQGSFGQSFAAERSYDPQHDLPEFESLQVTVAPKSESGEMASRSSDLYGYTLDVAVQKKLPEKSSDAVDLAAIDGLRALVSRIGKWWLRRRPGTMPEAVCSGYANEPVYSREHLREHRLFTSVLTLTFQMER